MNRLFAARVVVIRTVFALGLCALIACQPTDRNGGGAIVARTETHSTNGPTRDLSQDEAAGGHILRKHVGQTDDQLLARLEEERRITGASTYTDRSTAERAVGAAITASQDRIQGWLSGSSGHPNLVLDFDSPTPIGRTINRGESQSHPCSHALVVLKYAGPREYYVLTSYPECRS